MNICFCLCPDIHWRVTKRSAYAWLPLIQSFVAQFRSSDDLWLLFYYWSEAFFLFVLFPILVFVTGALHIINVQLFWKLMSYNGHLFVPIDL